MLQRLSDVFWPPKWKAAMGAIFCFVLAVLFFSTASAVFVIFGVVALIYCLWYAGVWLYKFNRDKQLAAQAQANAMQQRQQAQQLTPSRTTPDANPLFVPPQLPDER